MNTPSGSADATGISDDDLLEICNRVVDEVHAAVSRVADWSPPGEIPGQYAIDLVADRAALAVLDLPWMAVLSEESGVHRTGAAFTAVIDPIDGSTNASRGVPWYATSICILDDDGPRVSVVANQATKTRHHAIRGKGAWRDGNAVKPSDVGDIGRSILVFSGYPTIDMGWNQFRCLGAAALDLCAVADGTLDGFAAIGGSRLAPWDYLGALLVCSEAGALVSERDAMELVVLDHKARRSVVAAATSGLLDQIVAGAQEEDRHRSAGSGRTR